VPLHIYSSESEIYHPDAVLGDELCEGQTVTVVLGQRIPVSGAAPSIT
jgi:hypothetical protein